MQGGEWKVIVNGGIRGFARGKRSRAVVCATYVEPEDNVTIGWITGAPGELFVTGRVDNDWVVESAYCFIIGALASIHSFIIYYPSHATKKTRSHAVRVEWRPRLPLSTLNLPALSQLSSYHRS